MAWFLSGLLVAAAFILGAGKAMRPLSNPQFCARCHEMHDVHASWEESPHHTNSSGITVACVACHLPPRENHVSHLTARVWTSARDAWVHYLGRYDAEEARQHVLRTLPSARCVGCHGNLAGQPSSGPVEIVHAAALERPDDRRHACVACHDTLHGAPAGPAETKEYKDTDNYFCYVCHSNFEEEEFVVSHAEAGVGCSSCHGECNDHAADEESETPPDIMYSKAKVNPSCMTAECHPRERMEAEIGHRPFFAGAHAEREHCTDCHGAHRLETRKRRWDRTTRKLIEKEGHPFESGGEAGQV